MRYHPGIGTNQQRRNWRLRRRILGDLEEIRKANKEGRIGSSDDNYDKKMEKEGELDDLLKLLIPCVRGTPWGFSLMYDVMALSILTPTN